MPSSASPVASQQHVSPWLPTQWFPLRWLARRRSPRVALFRELCLQHNLTGRQRRLLEKLAQVQELAQPGSLFLDADAWNLRASARGQFTERQHSTLAEVRQLLFCPPPVTVATQAQLPPRSRSTRPAIR
jgi:hypothetical protein